MAQQSSSLNIWFRERETDENVGDFEHDDELASSFMFSSQHFSFFFSLHETRLGVVLGGIKMKTRPWLVGMFSVSSLCVCNITKRAGVYSVVYCGWLAGWLAELHIYINMNRQQHWEKRVKRPGTRHTEPR